MSVVNLDQRAGVVKPQTMPDTLPCTSWVSPLSSVNDHLQPTYNADDHHTQPSALPQYVETSRGWILRPALQWRGPTRRLGGWACRNVRQIVSKSAQVLYGEKRVNLRAGIAQRVGTGLRPGKLRKKALSEDNKDGELARGIDQGILMPEWLKLMSVGLAS